MVFSSSSRILTYSDLELPKASIEKLIRAALSNNSNSGSSTTDPCSSSSAPSSTLNLSKDAKLAITKSATLFISYLTVLAIDVASVQKQKLLSHDHVLGAIVDAGFGSQWTTRVAELVETLSKERKRAAKERQQKAMLTRGEEKGEGEEETQIGQEGMETTQIIEDEKAIEQEELDIATSEEEIIQSTVFEEHENGEGEEVGEEDDDETQA